MNISIFKKEFYNEKINILSVIFVTLYGLVALVSIIHLTSLIKLADTWFVTILNAFAYVLGISGLIVSSFFSKIVKIQYKILFWLLFAVLTGMELLGNIHHLHKNIDIDVIQPFCEVLSIDKVNEDEIFKLEKEKLGLNPNIDSLNRPNKDSVTILQSNYTIDKLSNEQDVYQKIWFSRIMGVAIVFIGMGFISLLMYFREQYEEDKKELELLIENAKKEEAKKVTDEYKKKIAEELQNLKDEQQKSINELTAKFNKELADKEETNKKLLDKINKLETKINTFNEKEEKAKQLEQEEEAEVFGFLKLKTE